LLRLTRDHRAFAPRRAISLWRRLLNCRALARPPIAASAFAAAFMTSGLGSSGIFNFAVPFQQA
jgi:hypothetical protein